MFQKIMIIGCPGSGKSTLSRSLSQKTGLPLHHLDMIYHLPDHTTRNREEFDHMLSDILQTPAWIIDGNYNRTLEMRLASCDCVVFLDFDTETCLGGIAERWGKPRTDMPWVETGEDPEFVAFVRDFASHSRPKILELLEKYASKQILIFHTRDEAWAWLENLNT